MPVTCYDARLLSVKTIDSKSAVPFTVEPVSSNRMPGRACGPAQYGNRYGTGRSGQVARDCQFSGGPGLAAPASLNPRPGCLRLLGMRGMRVPSGRKMSGDGNGARRVVMSALALVGVLLEVGGSNTRTSTAFCSVKGVRGSLTRQLEPICSLRAAHKELLVMQKGFGQKKAGGKAGEGDRKKRAIKVVEPHDVEKSQAHRRLVANAVTRVASEMIESLESKGYYMADGFLGEEAGMEMRSEAQRLYDSKKMSVGQSTRWNEKLNRTEQYEKHNVYTVQIEGGTMYFDAPRLTEYVVEATSKIAGAINNHHGRSLLLETHQTNKLAVCIGDGSSYAKHYDNQGGADRRKLTVLYYMNPSWAEAQGGCFRIFDPYDKSSFTDVAPKFDRLLCFWSDKLIHSVEPSFAENDEQFRYALTVWLYAGQETKIEHDSEAEKVHFSEANRT